MQKIADIWSRVLKADADAWAALVMRYEALVYTVARRTGLPGPESEDCAQQTWLALYRNRNAIKDPNRLPVWLIKTTQRRAIRLVRNLNRKATLAVPLDPTAVTPLPDEEVLRLERQAILEVALNRLDDRCGRLLRELFFAGGEKSYRDIAAELAIPVNSLGPTRSRCLKKLRRILSEMGYI